MINDAYVFKAAQLLLDIASVSLYVASGGGALRIRNFTGKMSTK